jgi:hypothetical protein
MIIDNQGGPCHIGQEDPANRQSQTWRAEYPSAFYPRHQKLFDISAVAAGPSGDTLGVEVGTSRAKFRRVAEF